MRSRSVIVIGLIGLGGMAAMAAVTKLAFDSDENLRDVARFKSRLLSVFAARGIEDAALRVTARTGENLLQLVAAASTSLAADERLHREIAELLVASFPKARGTLRLEYRSPARFGCRERDLRFETEFSIAELRALELERERREALTARLAVDLPHVEIGRVETRGRDVAVSVRLPAAMAASTPAVALAAPDLEALAERVASAARTAFALSMRARIEVTIERAAEVLAEAEYDGSGRRFRFDAKAAAPADAR